MFREVTLTIMEDDKRIKKVKIRDQEKKVALKSNAKGGRKIISYKDTLA